MGAWTATQEDDPRFRKPSGRLGQRATVASASTWRSFTTAVKYGMDITHVLLHNGELGKISKEQRSGNWDVWQTSLHNPSFAAFAELCGAKGVRVSEVGQLEGALEAALAFEGPALVEVMTDSELV